MSQRRTLALLHEELRNIEILDRIHDYAKEEDSNQRAAYVIRQLRRKQIQVDMRRLSKSELTKFDWVARAIVFVCAFSYVMLYFLFK
jgi:hypothetical protein